MNLLVCEAEDKFSEKQLFFVISGQFSRISSVNHLILSGETDLCVVPWRRLLRGEFGRHGAMREKLSDPGPGHLRYIYQDFYDPARLFSYPRKHASFNILFCQKTCR